MSDFIFPISGKIKSANGTKMSGGKLNEGVSVWAERNKIRRKTATTNRWTLSADVTVCVSVCVLVKMQYVSSCHKTPHYCTTFIQRSHHRMYITHSVVW